jgi:hypothetical protein
MALFSDGFEGELTGSGPRARFPVHVGVWDGALENHAPNFGYDDGGRLMAAWLAR